MLNEVLLLSFIFNWLADTSNDALLDHIKVSFSLRFLQIHHDPVVFGTFMHVIVDGFHLVKHKAHFGGLALLCFFVWKKYIDFEMQVIIILLARNCNLVS